MADVDHDKNKKKDIEEEELEEISHFKFTMTHTKHSSLERTTREVLKKVNQMVQDGVKIKCSGPARMPVKTLELVTRKSPCGNGTNTYDKWEMRIHKRVLHVYCSQKNFQSIVSNIHTEPGMILDAENVDEEEDEEESEEEN